MSVSLKGLTGLDTHQKQLLAKLPKDQRALQQLQMEEADKQMLATCVSNILKSCADGRQNTAQNIGAS